MAEQIDTKIVYFPHNLSMKYVCNFNDYSTKASRKFLLTRIPAISGLGLNSIFAAAASAANYERMGLDRLEWLTHTIRSNRFCNSVSHQHFFHVHIWPNSRFIFHETYILTGHYKHIQYIELGRNRISPW